MGLIHAGRAAEQRLEEALATVGLSGPKFAALSALSDSPDPLSLGDLAARLTCVRSNVTQLVDRLEMDGFVERLADPKDRRAVRALLTDSGRERQTAGAQHAKAVFAKFDAQLSDCDRLAISHLFTTLLQKSDG